jgi:hypothetical protein
MESDPVTQFDIDCRLLARMSAREALLWWDTPHILLRNLTPVQAWQEGMKNVVLLAAESNRSPV